MLIGGDKDAHRKKYIGIGGNTFETRHFRKLEQPTSPLCVVYTNSAVLLTKKGIAMTPWGLS